MAGPSLPVWFVQAHSVQALAGIGFEVAHDALRWDLRFHHRVNMSSSHMGCQQTPPAMCTHLLNPFQHSLTTHLVQIVRSLIHALRGCGTGWISLQNGGSACVVLAIHRAGFSTVQVASVASKGDEVSHAVVALPYGRGSG